MKNLLLKKLKTFKKDIINSPFNVIKVMDIKDINPLNCLVNYIYRDAVYLEIINWIVKKEISRLIFIISMNSVEIGNFQMNCIIKLWLFRFK